MRYIVFSMITILTASMTGSADILVPGVGMPLEREAGGSVMTEVAAVAWRKRWLDEVAAVA